MEIILLEKIENLGAMGEKVTVKPGFGRNYLVPKGKAKPATAENIAEFESRRAELEKIAAESLSAAEARREQIDGKNFEITAKAGEEGKRFGAVGTADIADAVKASGVDLERNEVRLPEGAFRVVGEYDVVVHLHTDVNATIKLIITAE